MENANVRLASIDSIVDQQTRLIQEWVPSDAIAVEKSDVSDLEMVSQGILYLGQKVSKLQQEMENEKNAVNVLTEEKKAMNESMDELNRVRAALEEEIAALKEKEGNAEEMNRVVEEKKGLEGRIS